VALVSGLEDDDALPEGEGLGDGDVEDGEVGADVLGEPDALEDDGSARGSTALRGLTATEADGSADTVGSAGTIGSAVELAAPAAVGLEVADAEAVGLEVADTEAVGLADADALADGSRSSVGSHRSGSIAMTVTMPPLGVAKALCPRGRSTTARAAATKAATILSHRCMSKPGLRGFERLRNPLENAT
jgi:hypothetical protein